MAFEQVTGALIAAFDIAFAPLVMLNPVFSLFAVSLIITLIILFFNHLLINKDMVKRIKDGMEEMREAMTSAQKLGDTAQVSKIMNDMMQLNSQYFKQTYKSLMISLVIVILFLPWVGARFADMELALPVAGYSVKMITVPVLGSEISAWIMWYILVSFTIGWILRKLLGFD